MKENIGKKIIMIIPVLLLLIPFVTADFGYVPKQTITSEYPENYGKYVNSTFILINKENNLIIVEFIPSSKIIIDNNITLNPFEKKNIPYTILVDSPSQEESIQVMQSGKNYGGTIVIKVNGFPNNQSYSEAIGFTCVETINNITCLSPLKNITVIKKPVEQSKLVMIIAISCFVVVILIIIKFFKKRNIPTANNPA